MLGGVNFYPSCRQISIGSSQTGTPNQSILFLGTYDDSDPERLRFGRVHIKATSIFPAPPLAPPKIGAPSISSQPIDSSSLSESTSYVTMLPPPQTVEAEMVCWCKVARAADVLCHPSTAICDALMPTTSATPCNRPSAHARTGGLGRVLSPTTYLAHTCSGGL